VIEEGEVGIDPNVAIDRRPEIVWREGALNRTFATAIRSANRAFFIFSITIF
jgi:hypothetical protein